MDRLLENSEELIKFTPAPVSGRQCVVFIALAPVTYVIRSLYAGLAVRAILVPSLEMRVVPIAKQWLFGGLRGEILSCLERLLVHRRIGNWKLVQPLCL